jgi:hypothetical protein
MNVFGRFFNSEKLKSEKLSEAALTISNLGYSCKDWNPVKTMSLYDHVIKYPQNNRFTVNLVKHDVLLQIDSERGLMAFAGDFINTVNQEEGVFMDEVTEFFEKIHSIYDFEFGFIDKEGDTNIKLFNFINLYSIETIFFLNYYGYKFVQKFGADLWLSAPGTATLLAGDTIKYYSRKKIKGPSKEEAMAVKEYFKDFGSPCIYRTKKSEDW